MLKFVKAFLTVFGCFCALALVCISLLLVCNSLGVLPNNHLPADQIPIAKLSRPAQDTTTKYFVISLEFAGASTEPTHVLVPKPWMSDNSLKTDGSLEFAMLAIPNANLDDFRGFKEGTTRSLPTNFRQWQQVGGNSDFFRLTQRDQYAAYSVSDADAPSGLVTMRSVFGFAR